ncbi:MAG: ABC transporter ATP-binding protein [Candidatus Aureabacteria bacterium]|nr:ABC transporter ATP-binding protein [Candidatus Auribacterota bacterium]
MNDILKIENLTKTFHTDSFLKKEKVKTTALDNISFSVKKGESLGILGPNGAGKSTLLRIISAILLPTKGHININEKDLSENPSLLKSKIGYINSNQNSFFARLTGYENLSFFAVLYGVKEKDKKINDLFETFEIRDKRNSLFNTYSTGMKKRLSIMRALLHTPDILLFDEATDSIDPLFFEKIKTITKDLKDKGTTMVWATHRIEEVEFFCDRVIILDKGKIIYETVSDLSRESLIDKMKNNHIKN